MLRVLAAVLMLSACSHPAAKIVPPQATPAVKPRLVVLIVIDQWPTWIFTQQRALFGAGIGRALREGAVIDAAELTYANTHTAPGHATLGTGAVPRVNGIVGNNWYRRAEGRERPAEYDPAAVPFVVGPALGGAELSTDDGTSGIGLRVDGVADALRKGTGGAGKSVAISFKSRAACVMAGRRPDLAIWYEPGAGGMTTSPAYATEAPAWLLELAKASPVSRYFQATWTAKDPALLARETKGPDDAAGENSNHGLGAVFPHNLAGNAKAAFALQETPFSDELVAETATHAIDKLELGRDEVPDFLAVSFSAHDLAGHGWGQESWEVLDLTLRLDVLIGQLFATLDARVGANQWAVVLTSDHGATPLIERARSPSARRIHYREIEDAVNRAIEAETKVTGPWVEWLVANNLYLKAKLAELPADVRQRALDAAVKAIAAIPSIGGAQRSDTIDPACTGGTDVDRAVCNAIVPGDAGEIYIYPGPGSMLTTSKFGTGHDAPNDDNRRVPIIVMAPGVTPQSGVGSTLQVAPTLAALLGVDPPSAAKAQPLFGITKR